MARDANGNYSLPAGNPVTSGDTISSTWANNTLADVGTELTNSLDRTGKGGMTGQFKFTDGSVSAPGASFTNETASGIYRAGTGDFRYAINGVDVLRIQAANLSFWSGAAWQTVWHANNDGAGSGLDADLLDGQEGTYYARLNQANTFSNSNVFSGSVGLTISHISPFMYINETDQVANEKVWSFGVAGKVLSLNAVYDGYTTPRAVLSATRGALSAIASIGIGNATDNPTVTINGNTAWHAGNDGPGTGLDADTLDGQHAAAFEPADATILKDADIGSTVAAQGHTHTGVYEPADATIVKDADFASNGILQRTSAGVYGIITNNSSNWNTAYGWGNHASAGYASLASANFSVLQLGGIAVGYLGIPRHTTGGTAAASWKGKCNAVSAGFSIDTSIFAAGDAFSVYNDSASAITITRGTITNMYRDGTDSATFSLGAHKFVTVWFNSASVCVIL